jgi:hypothetical protein
VPGGGPVTKIESQKKKKKKGRISQEWKIHEFRDDKVQKKKKVGRQFVMGFGYSL